MTPRMRAVRSTSVAAVGYDDQTNELHIEFVGGSRYIYALVPLSTYRALLDAESIGTFVNQRVKPAYPAREA